MNCENCGNPISPNAKFCGKCGKNINISNASVNTKETASLHGLGGWLIIVCIGLIYSLWSSLSTTFSDGKMFWDGTVESLNAIQGYAGALGFEVIAYAVLSIFAIYLLVLFYKKKISFPKLYVYFLISMVVVSIIDVVIMNLISYPEGVRESLQSIFDEGYTQTFKVLISAVIWGLYMKRSKRVKLTFVE